MAVLEKSLSASAELEGFLYADIGTSQTGFR